jgi:hypothetical protein
VSASAFSVQFRRTIPNRALFEAYDADESTIFTIEQQIRARCKKLAGLTVFSVDDPRSIGSPNVENHGKSTRLGLK